MNITGISQVTDNISVQSNLKSTSEKGTVSFKDLLMEEIYKVSKLDKEADAITADFIAGKTDSIHSVMIAAGKASISLQLMVEVRDKVLDAYNEIMRMQV